VDKASEAKGLSQGLRGRLTGPAGAMVFLVLLIAVFQLVLPQGILNPATLSVIMSTSAVTIVVALAQMVVLGSGGFNLSIGATGGLSAVGFGWALVGLQLNPVVAAVFAVLIGVAAGSINGLLVGRVGLSPFIATLATASVFAGTALGLTESQPFTGLPELVTDTGSASLLGVPWLFIAALGTAAFVGALFRFAPTGRQILALGASPKSAKVSGMRSARLLVITYALSGALGAWAAVLLVSRLGTAQPIAGSDWLLISFAAPILGGTLLSGGYVTATGTAVGAVILSVLSVGLIQAKVSPFYSSLVAGFIILAAAVLDRVRRTQTEQGKTRKQS